MAAGWASTPEYPHQTGPGRAETHTFRQSLKKFLWKTSLVVHSRCRIFPYKVATSSAAKLSFTGFPVNSTYAK